MDSSPASLDFAVIGHQDSWHNIAAFVNCIRGAELEPLVVEKVKDIFSFIPPRDLFKVNVRSATGAEINGVYIETFIDPDKLLPQFTRTNIGKIIQAASLAKKMGANIVALGGFTSIMLEGNIDELSTNVTKFTTGNTLTAAYIVKSIEKAANNFGIDLQESSVLIIGATGDIGTACINYLAHKVNKLLLCARNHHRLQNVAANLVKQDIRVEYSTCVQDLAPKADVVICAASSSGIELVNCKQNVLICDAGYPKNLEEKIEDREGVFLFHGGMGQVTHGFNFNPDYSESIYRYAAPHIIHGCILEAMILAFEKKYENYSAGKGNITAHSMEDIYNLSVKHGINIAPFYNAGGLCQKTSVLKTLPQ
ncbi:MAG: hypothetical protein ABIN67_18650 [Ferruginibacter sp.]